MDVNSRALSVPDKSNVKFFPGLDKRGDIMENTINNKYYVWKFRPHPTHTTHSPKKNVARLQKWHFVKVNKVSSFVRVSCSYNLFVTRRSILLLFIYVLKHMSRVIRSKNRGTRNRCN